MAQTQPPVSSDLAARSNAAMNAEIAKIRSAAATAPQSKFAQANQHVLTSSFTPSVCGGTLETAGFIWWTLSCTGAGTNLSMAYDFSFEASGGPDWDISIFTCEVAGSFVVDPSTISGPANFTLAIGGLEEGAVALSLYSFDNQTFYGTLAGLAEGVGGAGLSGSGTLSVNSTS
jgi:hypothetical protein